MKAITEKKKAVANGKTVLAKDAEVGMIFAGVGELKTVCPDSPFCGNSDVPMLHMVFERTEFGVSHNMIMSLGDYQ